MDFYRQEVKVRIFHAATIGKPVDVYINDEKVISNLQYRRVTDYINLSKGKFNIKIYESGTGKILYNQTINLDGDKFITLSAISETGKLNLIVVEDLEDSNRFGDITDLYTTPLKANNDRASAKIRFVHLSSNAPGVDITLSDGTKLFVNTKYKQVTNYEPVGPGPYTIQIRKTGTNTILQSIPSVTFEDDQMYTIYAIGLMNNTPKLEGIILKDGLSE
jgi:Domain of unknown function (DUF4397)